MASERAVTLDEVLLARDQRVTRQREMLRAYSVPVISYLVNIPGAWKCTPLSVKIFNEGLSALDRTLVAERLIPIDRLICYLPTGPEALLSVPAAAIALKWLLTQIEDHHPLGRLFDFDLIGLDQEVMSRETLGMAGRQCLLCDADAHECSRSRKHSLDELIVKIRFMAQEYFEDGGDARKG